MVEQAKAGFKGWHERGYLPHRDEPGLTQMVTFHVADSFPNTLRSEWAALYEIEDDAERSLCQLAARRQPRNLFLDGVKLALDRVVIV